MMKLLVNCGEIAHLSTGDDEFPLTGRHLLEREKLVYNPGKAILIQEDRIHKIAPSSELIAEFAPWYPAITSKGQTEVIDVRGMAVVPGFVDCHTHLVWTGNRSNELSMRQSGRTYQEIAVQGGGIKKTVTNTRISPIEELVASGMERANIALKNGTTSMEAKSGYGLDTNTEIKILEAISKINMRSECNISSTWLGAHDFPTEMKRRDYMEQLISDQLPIISELSLAKWSDVFCEDGWYTLEETEEIVNASKEYGLGSRLHVDEFVDSGGLALAAELGAVSGDHVACSNAESRTKASESGTVQTFLPGTPYVLGRKIDSPINECIREDWSFAAATDFNPNCPILSLPFIGSLLSHRLNVDPIVSLASVTRNSASTMFDGKDVRGVISEGQVADLNILWASSADSWCQTPGSSPVNMTLASGNIVKS